MGHHNTNLDLFVKQLGGLHGLANAVHGCTPSIIAYVARLPVQVLHHGLLQTVTLADSPHSLLYAITLMTADSLAS